MSPAHAGIFASINTRHAWWMRVTRICGDFRPVLRSRRAMWFVTRTRGDFRIGQRRIDSLGVYHPIMLAFPPVNRGGAAGWYCHPRTRGFSGFARQLVSTKGEYHPHARGLSRGLGPQDRRGGVLSPAPAGISVPDGCSSAFSCGVTRTRGDFRAISKPELAADGVSPAHAGISGTQLPPPRGRPCVTRARGDFRGLRRGLKGCRECHPHARGFSQCIALRPGTRPVSPACAGISGEVPS